MTEASNVTAGRPKATAEPSPRQGDTEQSGIAAVAFDSLLDSTRTLVRAETQAAQRASPAQMFEAPTADSGESRKASIEEQQRSDRTEARRDTAHEPTGVAARRSAQNQTRSGPAPVPTSNETPVTRSPREEAASVRSGMSPSNARAASAAQGRTGPMETSSPSRHMADAPTWKENVASPQPGRSAVGVTGATAVEARPALTPNVAQQVGELLGAARVGGVESVQGASSPSAAGDAPPNRPPEKTNPSAPPNRTGQPGASTRRPDEAEAKEASPFERLVRSIRLQTGARSSSARLQLHPPELGRLRVDVRLAGEEVEIDVRTETDAARDLVARRADELKTALEQYAIHVNRLDVTTNAASERHPGLASYDGPAVSPDAQRHPSWPSARRQAEDGRTDDAGVTATVGDASTTAAVAEARLDIRV